jgi:hypothetical protein
VLKPFILLALASFVAPATAQTVYGELEMQWGDPKPVPQGQVRPKPIFQVHLVDQFGRKQALDPAQAQRAAGDLFMMSGKPVAIEFGPSSAKAPRNQNIEAIVPIRLSSKAHPVSQQAMAQGAAIGGNTRWVTIACKFSDVATEHKPISFFTSQYGTAPGQLGHYWSEVSYGKINLAGSQAYGWFNLPNTRAFYMPVGQRANLGRLFEDCAGAADATVNFNGVAGINMMFNGELDGFAWGGSSCATIEGVRQCPRVTWNPPWSFNNLAPLAHEMGHGYGLPHSDNSDGDTDTYDNPWDNMSDAWNRGVSDATYGTRPKHINVFQRDRLGWIDSPRKITISPTPTETQHFTLDAASMLGSNNPQMIVLQMPASADPYSTSMYTLEARVRTGNFESNLAGDAVIIHRIASVVAYSIDADTPPATNSSNEGSMFKVGETWNNGRHWVSITGRTATGFTVSVGPQPQLRVTGGNLPARLVNGGAIPTQGASPGGAIAPKPKPASVRSTTKPTNERVFTQER